ncbi:MAG: arylsulfatase [Candidatus Hodarchaeota archaeon]
MPARPNIILILADDMGYSDIGCYGGDIDTPNLDKLASNGVRLTQFYNTAKCSPSRASLLTGLHPHQVGMGILASPDNMSRNMPEGYTGDLSRKCITIAELLKEQGYGTYLSGKWHLANDFLHPNENWPMARGFDHHYGNINGSTSYFYPGAMFRDEVSVNDEAKDDPDFYYTDKISDNACEYIKQHSREKPDEPFFLYVAYTCPHWPLHARDVDIKKYKGRFDEGYDVLREKRVKKLRELGILEEKWQLSERYIMVEPWDEVEEKEWFLRRMEVYAAQIDNMDQGIGRIVKTLEDEGKLENTLIIFLSDNGASKEEINTRTPYSRYKREGSREFTRDGKPIPHGNRPEMMPGGEETFMSYGVGWANLSNVPFRLFKNWTHEGGIATPFIVHWPATIKDEGGIRHQFGQLTDMMATIIDITSAEYPKVHDGHEIPALEGKSLMPIILENKPNGKDYMFFEHHGNAAVREGKWKLVTFWPGPWELYDMEADRSELNNLSSEHPERVESMRKAYEDWANRCNVLPREEVLKLRGKKVKKAKKRAKKEEE